MADRMLPRRVHLAESLGLALRHEDRIITEPVVAAGRPDQLAANNALEAFDMTIGPRQRQHADEAGAAIDLAIRCGLGGKAVLDLLHRRAEILPRTGPARG